MTMLDKIEINFADFSVMTAEASVAISTSIAIQGTQPTTSMLTIIAIAVSGGVVVLIFIVTACGIAICCILYSKMRKMSANQVSGPPSASTNEQFVDNPSYNVVDNDLQLVSNQSYNQAPNLGLISDSQLINNPACYSNNEEDPYYSVVH